MRPHHISIVQRSSKSPFIQFFYGQILRLTGENQLSEDVWQWYDSPVHLLSRSVSEGTSTWMNPGGFTGIQLNVTPAKDLNAIVAALRATSIKQPEPKDMPDQRIMMVHDPSGNTVMIVGTDDPPEEPTLDEGIGSLTVFVSNIKMAQNFYVEGLGLPVKARPFDGLLVMGEPGEMSILVYQVAEDNPQTPVGRATGLAFTTPNVADVLQRVVESGGRVVDQAEALTADGRIPAATISDAEGNEFQILAEDMLKAPVSS